MSTWRLGGSNIANSLLILGAAVMITPLVLERATALRDPLIAFIAALGFAATFVLAYLCTVMVARHRQNRD